MMILPATHQLLTHNYQEMMRLLIAGIVALFYLSETSGECPNMDDIPVMYDKERFTCGCNYARRAQEWREQLDFDSLDLGANF